MITALVTSAIRADVDLARLGDRRDTRPVSNSSCFVSSRDRVCPIACAFKGQSRLQTIRQRLHASCRCGASLTTTSAKEQPPCKISTLSPRSHCLFNEGGQLALRSRREDSASEGGNAVDSELRRQTVAIR